VLVHQPFHNPKAVMERPKRSVVRTRSNEPPNLRRIIDMIERCALHPGPTPI
jgi:hypothetical protein